MSRKQPKNKYDVFIDSLSNSFKNIPNFHLTQEDGVGKIIFNFVINRLVEIQTFKSLFTHYYLPASLKAVQNDLQSIRSSKYKNIISITNEELKENYYETIRLGYIGMFHKYENYIHDLIKKSELLIADAGYDNISLKECLKTDYDFKPDDWHIIKTIKRINWISNCNKHADGYPIKPYAPPEFESLPKNEKMKLTKDDFVHDIEKLLKFYELLLQIILYAAVIKIAELEFSTQNDSSIEDRVKRDVSMIQFKQAIKILIDSMKNI